MLTPLTPEVRLAQTVERRATEAQVIARLVDLAGQLVGEASPEDRQRWERQRDDADAVLRGARAMLSDLVEDLGRVQDRVLALPDARRSRSATDAAAAA